jgi:HK97 family phage prohead protease
MPYSSTADLPPRVKNHLTPHQQTIFVSAFNNALKQYGNEKSAYRVAWAAARGHTGKMEKELPAECLIYSDITKFEPLSDGTIKVYGVASSPVRDSVGEIVTPGAMSKALGDYRRFPTIREMHRADNAAGRALDIFLDEEDKTQLVAHVVDSDAVKKVKAKVYAGFSIGGRVKKRRNSDPSIIEEIDLVEISLVDRPCNPEAAISLWKRKEEMTQQQIEELGDTLRKDSDDGSQMRDFEDRERWDDDWDGGGDAPHSPRDSGPHRTRVIQPSSDSGGAEKDFQDDSEWYGDEFGEGADPDKETMPSAPTSTGGEPARINSRSKAPRTQANATQDSSKSPSKGGKTPDGFETEYFSPAAEHSNTKAADGYPIWATGKMIAKREFNTAHRRRAAASGAAMKDGSFPIENAIDLANARHAIGRAHPSKRAAVREHIRRRAKALGIALPEDWGRDGKVQPSQNIHNTLAVLERADKAMQISLEALSTLEVKVKRGKATDETIRLAKAYKAMPEDELAEVLGAAQEKASTEQGDTLVKLRDGYEAMTLERAELLKKIGELTDLVASLGERIQKLASMPMPAKTAANSFVAVSKTEDTQGRQELTAEDRAKAQELFVNMSEQDRVFLLTKAALGQGREFNLRPVANPPRSAAGGAAGR